MLKSRTENKTRIAFNYNKADKLTSITNEQDSIYRFKRDAVGNILEESGFDGLLRQYTRNAAGQVIKQITPDNRNTQYFYDSIGNLNKVLHYNKLEEVFSYYKLGQLITAVNKNGAVTLDRDPLGNIIKESLNGIDIESSYNRLGQRIEVKSSLGAQVEFDRNKLGLIQGIKATEAANTWQTQIKRNVLGQEIERLLPGGIQSSFKIDYKGKPIKHSVSNETTTFFNKRYDWDANDRLQYIYDAVNDTGISFHHDAFGNLASAQYGNSEQIFKLPDEVGNLFKTKDRSDRKYDKASALLEDENYTYSYDAVGNLLNKIHKTKPESWYYRWDKTGMLQSVNLPERKEVRFTYDALGRRLTKTFDDQTTHFVWDGNMPLHEWTSTSTKPNSTINDAGEWTITLPEKLTTWVFEDGTFIPSAKIVGEEQYSIIADYLGTLFDVFRGMIQTDDSPFVHSGDTGKGLNASNSLGVRTGEASMSTNTQGS